MQHAIVGATGFIGKYLTRIIRNAVFFNSENCSEMQYGRYNILFCAGISGTKWKANADPVADQQAIDKLFDCLSTVEVNQVVWISTVDVYGANARNTTGREDTMIDFSGTVLEPYGFNRHNAELRALDLFGAKKTHIVRLGALFGFGLKKNLLFDFIGKSLSSINGLSSYQWYSLEWLENDLDYILKHNIHLINLCTEPLSNIELKDEVLLKFKKWHQVENFHRSSAEAVTYNVKTNFSSNCTRYWRSKSHVIASLCRYLTTMCDSNIILTNLAQVKNINREVFTREFGIRKLEIAPYRFFGASFTTKPLEYFSKFKNHRIYSFQALFYPETFQIETDFEAILSHIQKIIDIALVVGAQVLVFGAPKLRSHVQLSVAEHYKVMLDFFRQLAQYIGQRKLVICLEPNARVYGCNFLTTARDTVKFLETLNCPQQIKLMLDTGCMSLAKENHLETFRECLPWLRHVHFSVPHLKSFISPTDFPSFCYLKYKLQKMNYQYSITLEMLNVSNSELSKSVALTVKDPSFLVVGGGWYGCHLTKKLLEDGLNPILYEKASHLFAGVSGCNQNRLHEGFHYARSHVTRMLCMKNYPLFMQEYGGFTKKVEPNLYCVSQESTIDFETFDLIVQDIPHKKEILERHNIQHCQGQAFLTRERFIESKKAVSYFTKRLARFIQLNWKYKEDIDARNFDGILDCTYNQERIIPNVHVAHTVLLLYKINTSCITTLKGFCFVDGEFCSLFPYDPKLGLYALTHVRYGTFDTPPEQLVLVRRRMERAIQHYLPYFSTTFTFAEALIVEKRKPTSPCDSRELKIKERKNITHFYCGKISGIFAAEAWILPADVNMGS